jgi:hypothetical protein
MAKQSIRKLYLKHYIRKRWFIAISRKRRINMFSPKACYFLIEHLAEKMVKKEVVIWVN